LNGRVATCPVCGKTVAVRIDGLLSKHGAMRPAPFGTPCSGSGNREVYAAGPRPGSVA